MTKRLLLFIGEFFPFHIFTSDLDSIRSAFMRRVSHGLGGGVEIDALKLVLSTVLSFMESLILLEKRRFLELTKNKL